jgi:hypothetical protein
MSIKLEVISPHGQTQFYTLNMSRGVTNIGQDLRNDIVIDSPLIAPFHAVLKHQQEPFRIVVMARGGQNTLRGGALPVDVPVTIQPWDILNLNGYILTLFSQRTESATPRSVLLPVERRTSSSPRTEPLPARPADLPPPVTRPERALVPSTIPINIPPPSETTYYTPRTSETRVNITPPIEPAPSPFDYLDEVIITELDGNNWVIDVEQTAECELTIVNGGDIVAGFYVQVFGVPPEWLTITPPQVNLYEGDRASVLITITPPRYSGSRAGTHPLSIVVISPDYSGRQSQRAATLTINPYYQFTTGELAPKRQSISWFRRFGSVNVPVINKSNTPTLIRMEGEDDEHGCSFEFDPPGEAFGLARQADFVLEPEEEYTMPITITPHSRRLVGLRKRSYSFTITTLIVEGLQTPRSMLGTLSAAPLIGPSILTLLGLLLAAGLLYVFWPVIDLFTVDRRIVNGGEEVNFSWNASPFVSLRLNNEPVESPQGTTTMPLDQTTTFTLRADNWLRRILPDSWTRESAIKEVEIFVTPVPPRIMQFDPDQTNIITGQSIRILIDVSNADEVVLQSEEGNRLLSPVDYQQGITSVSPDQDTAYRLVATNRYGSAEDSIRITVNEPTPTPTATTTPIPTPSILLFSVQPQVITAGQEVQLQWQVQNAQSVFIDPIDVQALPNGNISHSPPSNTSYVLRAVNGPVQAISPPQVVVVNPPPTGTATPAPPAIVFFTAEPNKFVRGDRTTTVLKWSVSGQVTNVEISGPGLAGPISNLNKEGSLELAVSNTTSFVLTAFNQDQKMSQTVQVELEEPTPTPTPSATPTGTPIPASIVEFRIASPGSPQVVQMGSNVYQAQVGANLIFSWVTNNAVKVIFTPANGAATEGSPIGQSGTQRVNNAGTLKYTLVAENGAGQRTSVREITVEVIDKPPPDPPFSVLGVENIDVQNMLTWQVNSDPNKSDITGYRIYRASVPGGNFSPIGETSDKSFVDPVSPTCGLAYFVVALYEDISGSIQESPASLNSWNSALCPVN